MQTYAQHHHDDTSGCKECTQCDDDVRIDRWAIGYRLCFSCGEKAARAERASWCVIQEYGKGGYQLVTPETALHTLKQTNQKDIRT